MWNFLRKAQIPLRVTFVIALAYLGYVFLARRTADQQFKARQEKANTPTPGQQAKFDAAYGGKEVRILQFYVRDSVIAPGKQTVLCYGVVNAKSLKVEPSIRDIYPAINHCVDIGPSKTTDYVMTAEGEDGKKATAALTLRVE